MDCQMPEMDGFKTTAFIRSQSNLEYRNIPIIALTTYALKGDCEKCQAVGMNDYVIKPVRVEDLSAAIDRLLS